MITKKIEHFNLKQICNSGQCFRMNQIADGRYSVIAGQEIGRASCRERV